MNTTILLADDHAILRAGLRTILAARASIYRVVGEAATGQQAVEMSAQLCPDIVIMDIAMPDLNGVEATRRILRADPKICIIALSTYQDRHFVRAMLEAGAAGYVVKSGAAEELLDALTSVLAGKRYLSPQVAQDFPPGKGLAHGTGRGGAADDETFCGSGTGQLAIAIHGDLTTREREILQLVAEGRSSRLIAARLGLSTNTVQVHRRNIMKKLGLRNVAGLTRYAINQGITVP